MVQDVQHLHHQFHLLDKEIMEAKHLPMARLEQELEAVVQEQLEVIHHLVMVVMAVMV